MRTVHEQLENPLTRERNTQIRSRLAAAFPALQSCTDQPFMALRCYLDSRPEKFFDEVAYNTHLGWLIDIRRNQGHNFRQHLLEVGNEINRAFFFLREVNGEEWHERALDSSEYEQARFIDRHVHPTYLRLIEAVLIPLSTPVAFFSRLARNKSTDGLDVWSVMQELKKFGAGCYVRHYRAIVRNGIAHGGITFLQNAIRYRDKKGNEEVVDTRSIVRLCDDLLDTCNGLSVALKVFYLISREQGYVPPREWFIEELREETWAPWWRIDGCVESESTGKSQLIIYVRPNTRHYRKVQWSAMQTGILAEFFAPGYDRYFLSLCSSQAWPGWAAFDGQKLRTLRETEENDLSQFKGVVVDDLIFYVTEPAMPDILGKLDTFVSSIRIHAPLAMQQIRSNLKIPRIVCRSAAVHRNSWGAVLNAVVVIDRVDDGAMADAIRQQRRRIIRLAVAQARRERRDSDRYKVINFIGVAACNSIPHETHRGPARVRPSVPWAP